MSWASPFNAGWVRFPAPSCLFLELMRAALALALIYSNVQTLTLSIPQRERLDRAGAERMPGDDAAVLAVESYPLTMVRFHRWSFQMER
jgi:hypothetical protein